MTPIQAEHFVHYTLSLSLKYSINLEIVTNSYYLTSPRPKKKKKPKKKTKLKI